MKTTVVKTLLLATFTFTFTPQSRAQDAEAAELKKLQGTWIGRVASPGVAGRSGSGTMVSITELVIKGSTITASGGMQGGPGGGDLGEGAYKINLSAKPKTLDAVGSGGRTDGKNYLGIYKFDGETLEWCAANPGIPRPKDFFTKPQVQFHLVLIKKK